jgi:pimeloyl-ACP methyl ester carboxylesterase
MHSDRPAPRLDRAATRSTGSTGADAGIAAQPFSISLPDAVLDDLRARLRATRWPDPAPGEPWSQGTDLDYLRSLVTEWADGFDWRARERELNGMHHYRATLDGFAIHFVHERAVDGHGIPLILIHGWPSTFLEYLPLVPLLTDPAIQGVNRPSFDLVIPSLPGYAFSERPDRTGVNYRYVADLWHRLMVGLGYERYGAGGGDFGAGVATFMALDRPDRVTGIHLSNLELAPYTGPGSRPPSAAEQTYLGESDRWWTAEGGYKALQTTRPQTLGYALTDSPAGLAAWIVEKWRAWTDSGGDVEAVLSRDQLLTMLTIVWATRSITTSMRDYYDNRWHGVSLGPDDRVTVPTAVAGFTHQLAFEGDPPREWAERLYNVRRWTPMPRGGHFAPVEEPEPLADDIAAFFAGL